MRYKLDIDMSNAAFADAAPGAELARILRSEADKLDGRLPPMVETARPVCDVNGNRVGHVSWEN